MVKRWSLFVLSVIMICYLQNNTAYYCFCSPKRLDLLRRDAVRRGETPRYDNRCRHLPPEEVKNKLASKTPYVIRLKVQSWYCCCLSFLVTIGSQKCFQEQQRIHKYVLWPHMFFCRHVRTENMCQRSVVILSLELKVHSLTVSQQTLAYRSIFTHRWPLNKYANSWCCRLGFIHSCCLCVCF